MPIINRTKDISEQKRVWTDSVGAVGISTLRCLDVASQNLVIEQVQVAAQGISGTPLLNMQIQRFIVGVGSTTIVGGATALTLQAMGTSGLQSMVLAAAGSTLLNLQKNDCLQFVTSGANSAVTDLSLTTVLRYTQDYKSFF